MVKNKTYLNPEKSAKWWESDIVINSSEEASICLNCPLPNCKKDHCKRYYEELKKIKERKKNEQKGTKKEN